MLLLGLLVAFLAFGAGILYWLLGTNRYGGDRPASALQITATASALASQALKPEPCRTIRVYFIKPSRYDEEGYVQYFRYGVQPNNTLTVLTALNAAFNKRYAVERNVRLDTVIWDEICDGVVSPETITAIKDKAREDGVELLIGLAGVQSNQYPRGRDLALQFVGRTQGCRRNCALAVRRPNDAVASTCIALIDDPHKHPTTRLVLDLASGERLVDND